MGELTPEPVAKLDMGTEAIVQQSVVIPTEEKLIGFNMELTKDGNWSRYDIRTGCRNISVEPGNLGEEPFDNLCGKVKAMWDTIEGQAVLTALRGIVKSRPLSVSVNMTEGV